MSAPTRRASTLRCLLALLLFIVAACADRSPPLDPEATHPLAAAGGPNVVHVAPPEGNPAADQASILAALQEVRPGGTVQFAPGTYVIGVRGEFAWIRVTVPRVTLQGHPDGTTLQGCDLAENPNFLGGCNGLQLVGGRQTVRDLTFEYFNQPLIVGFFLFREAAQHQIGGYRIENNTFRSAIVGVRMFGQWTQPAVVRNNTFVNMAFGVQIFGMTAHIADNDISAPDWGQIPTFFVADTGIMLYAWDDLQTGACNHNLVARNRIESHIAGVGLGVESEEGCRHNVIRDNTILNSMEADPLPAGPIWLENYMGDPDLLAHTLVQGNHILGSQGLGVYAWVGAQVRFVNNTIRDLTLSQYSPGYLGESNGSGVWVSPGSRNNQILNNRFANVEAEEVILEGDYNHVATTSASDVVRDLGIGNRVTGPGSVVTTAAPAGASAGAAPNAADGTGTSGMLRERLGVRARMLEEGWREAAPR